MRTKSIVIANAELPSAKLQGLEEDDFGRMVECSEKLGLH